MKNITTKELNEKVFNYILDSINGEGYGIELRTNEDKLNFLAVTFKNEYLFPANLKRYGSHLEVFKQWIQGLPSSFSIVSYNYEIIDLAKEWGSLPQNATDSEENKIIANYFHFIASKTFQLMKKYKVLPY